MVYLKEGRFMMNHKGQNAIEYLLLLALVVGIVLVGFRQHLPTVYNSANEYYNRASEYLVGEPPRCGDGACFEPHEVESGCCIDCGHCVGCGGTDACGS